MKTEHENTDNKVKIVLRGKFITIQKILKCLNLTKQKKNYQFKVYGRKL